MSIGRDSHPVMAFRDKDNTVVIQGPKGFLPNIEEVILIRKAFQRLERKGQDYIDQQNQEQEAYLQELMSAPSQNTKPSKPQKGYVYLMKCNGLYKIGITKKPKSRIQAYKTENPFEQKFIFCKLCENYLWAENTIKKKYGHKKKQGNEWLELSKDEVDSIKKFIHMIAT